MGRKKKEIDEQKIVHDEEYNAKKIKLIGFVAFLMGFAQAFFIYIMSSYFKEVSGTENVGIFYFVSYAFVFAALLNLHKIVKVFGKSNVFYFSLIFKIACIAFLIYAQNPIWIMFLLIFYIIIGNIEWVSVDVILESFSADKMSGRIRGKHLTLMNAGYLLGPFLSTYILEKYNFSGVFFLLLVFNAIIFVIAILSLRNVNHKFDGDVTVKDLIKKVWARKNILRIYYLSSVLELFYTLMAIYTPIYLLDLGFSWEKIGIILTVMLIPFVILQYPMGVLADKRLGEKELLITSLFIMGISTAIIYFVGPASVLIWAAVLFLTRIGAAMLEILRDSYFYKKIDAHDVDLINFFRTAMPMGTIAGTILSFVFLMVFPLKTVFALIALVVFSALIPAAYLLDNKCEKEL